MTIPRTEPIPVVCLWLAHKGRILVVQHGPGRPNAGLWEFPGGKIETGESPGTAIRREILEELGIQVQPVLPLEGVVFTYPTLSIRLIPVICNWQESEIRLHEHVSLDWIDMDGLNALPMAPADAILIQTYAASLESLIRQSDS